jgi:hypothetical protein
MTKAPAALLVKGNFRTVRRATKKSGEEDRHHGNDEDNRGTAVLH